MAARVIVTDASDDASVRVVWRIEAAVADGAVRVRAIPFFDRVPIRLTAYPDEDAVRIELGPAGRALEGIAPLRAGVTELVMRYTVPGAVAQDGERLDIRVPLVLIDGVPAGSGDDFFTAELLAPSGVTLIESFPTVPQQHDASGAERYGMALQVVPSLLRWRATTGDPPLLPFDAAVDLALLLLLAVLAVFGVRALRRSA